MNSDLIDSCNRQSDACSYSLLKKITIVVFTRSRPAYARRQAEFWEGRGPTVLILDNGLEAWSDNILTGLSDDVHYLHDAGGYYRQLRQSGELVKTEYAILIDDDNFLIDEGLEACIRELESHSDLIAVSGKMCSFRFWKGRVILHAPDSQYLKFRHNSPDIEDRVSRKFNPYGVTGWYAVQRREVFRLIMTMVADVSEETACAYACEIGLEMGLAVLGPTTNIPNLTVLRSQENPPEDDAGHSRSLYFHTWWLDEKYCLENEDYVRALSALAPDTTATLTPLMVQELNQFATTDMQKFNLISAKHNSLASRSAKFRAKFRVGLQLATDLLSPKTRSRGLTVVPTATRAGRRPSADLIDVTPGLVRVVTAVQHFYVGSKD
ncbi:MAG: TIGR00180 family glycosyltransferase [Candidatus Nanopelagicales bacterium]|nr:TIGR00180 family glycosyltransferase [Candidatus Nanopelagicales bacterium]